MSERNQKLLRRLKREARERSLESIMADGTSQKKAERIFETLTQKPAPVFGHSPSLCKSALGLHDYGPQPRRQVKRDKEKGLKVVKHGPREKVCRSCSRGEKVQTRLGFWINKPGSN